MKSFQEITAKLQEAEQVSREKTLTLLFEWVKTGVITKNQFIGAMTFIEGLEK